MMTRPALRSNCGHLFAMTPSNRRPDGGFRGVCACGGQPGPELQELGLAPLSLSFPLPSPHWSRWRPRKPCFPPTVMVS